ncbi:MAG: four helix bundle protein [Acidobacteria bacterium]|nr:MAG: four helix bundle protein [Acidobacteriota bacterium]
MLNVIRPAGAPPGRTAGLPAAEGIDARVVGRQALRAATGLGANYRAACRARSRADFVSKIGIALEEADESGFWLELVAEGHLSSSKVVYQLLEEANQLSAIFAASRITAAEALRHERQPSSTRNPNLQ